MARGNAPDKRPRKGSPRLGRPAKGRPPVDDSPSRARRARALDLLSTGRSPYQVAEEIGVTHQIVYRWMAREDFAVELDARIAEGRAAAVKILQSSAAAAAQTLNEVAREGDQTHGPRVKAAEAILDRIGLTVESKVQVQVSGRLDVSRLSDAELDALIAEEAGRVAGLRAGARSQGGEDAAAPPIAAPGGATGRKPPTS